MTRTIGILAAAWLLALGALPAGAEDEVDDALRRPPVSAAPTTPTESPPEPRPDSGEAESLAATPSAPEPETRAGGLDIPNFQPPSRPTPEWTVGGATRGGIPLRDEAAEEGEAAKTPAEE